MKVFEFMNEFCNSPQVAIGKIKGGLNVIRRDKALVQSTLVKASAVGLGSFILLRSTLFTLTSFVFTGAYLCWDNGSWTSDSFEGHTRDAAKKVETVYDKGVALFSSWFK